MATSVRAWLAIAAITAVASYAGATPLFAQEPATRTERSPGLITTRFATLQGEVVVHLPDDMAAGDRISGAVLAEPAGATAEERRANTAQLSGYVVEVESVAEEKPQAEGGGTLTWLVPVAAGTAALVLRDPGGEAVARAPIEVEPQPPVVDVPDSPAASDYRLPEIGQAGSPVVIAGPFDGAFPSAGSGVTVGGVAARPLAESPRQLVFESPPDVVGPIEIVLRDGQVEARGEYRAIGVRLSAPKTSLVRGERTTLTMTVDGLQGIDRPVELTLENRSPGVVSMEGGESQRITIEPPQVRADGTASLDRELSGIAAGTFTIVAMAPAFAGAPAMADHDAVGSSRRGPHLFETTKTWMSRGHTRDHTREWPGSHEFERSLQDNAPDEHADETSRDWYHSDHADAMSRRWQQENHAYDTSISWRGIRGHAYEATKKWVHEGHIVSHTETWEKDSHAYETTRTWRNDGHAYVVTDSWKSLPRHSYEATRGWVRDGHDVAATELGHAIATTRDWQAVRHDYFKTREWGDHAFADSREWMLQEHQLADTRRWNTDRHEHERSRRWRTENHRYDETRRW